MSDGYYVGCWNCLGEFDATAAVWCSDDPKNLAKVCPFCLRCFCEASAEYKQQFWRAAPAELVEELQLLSRSQDRLGDILIRMKRITTPQLLEALCEQRASGQKLGTILVARGLVGREDVEAALRHQGIAKLEDAQTGGMGNGYWKQSSPDTILDHLLALAARKRASDLTLEPQAEEVAVRYRIDGFSFRVDPVPRIFEPALERALFAMFGLDPARRGRPQTARIAARLGEESYDLVLQTVPAAHGVTSTVKLINRSTFIKDFGTLGLELEDRVRVVEELRSGVGLVIVSSPAYNGAITTSYAVMSFLAQGQTEVLSVEAPIHWRMERVRQVEAEPGPPGCPQIEPALRAMMAVRPDALMVSAVPDTATAMLVTQLASSLLVVAQLPATRAARAVVALRDMGVPPTVLAGSLGVVTSQRLVRVVCGSCRVRTDPPAPQQLAAHGIDPDEARTLRFYKGSGCPSCNTVGYRGRRAVFETLPATDSVCSVIERGGGAREIERAAIESGMVGLRERCLALVHAGATTWDEFARLRL